MRTAPDVDSTRSPAFLVESENVRYEEDAIYSRYTYQNVEVLRVPGHTPPLRVIPRQRIFQIKTERQVPRIGVMMVGLGGNNGTTVTAGILANRRNLSWETKEGCQNSNWYGSLTQSSTMKLGVDAHTNEDIFLPLRDVLPMARPEEWVIGGWDISCLALGDAMKRARVLDVQLQSLLYEELQQIRPLPGIYNPDFIAANQAERANNTLEGTKASLVEQVRENIRDFKRLNKLDKVIILWTANTERFAAVAPGLNDTAQNLLAAIERNEDEISPSTLYCVASILEGCSYVNGSPQNTFVPGVIQLAMDRGVFLAGDDFKSGQTKLKSVLVDFLVSAGIKPTSIVSYNHLGNNDGQNLSSPQQFRSKEISKSNVVDDMVSSNPLLYKPGERPDHVVVIKYVPYVGDSKRALDEYTSEIFLGGKNTIVVHNTCEDSLLAAPLIVDLVCLTELSERIHIRETDHEPYERMHSVLSLLSYLCKAPMVPEGTPVKNALAAQRDCIVNILRACLALPPENHMLLEAKLRSCKSSPAAQKATRVNGNSS